MSIQTLSGVIDQFVHLPIGMSDYSLDTGGPYTGNVTLTSWSHDGPAPSPTPIARSMGAIVRVRGIVPEGWGFSRGWDPGDGGSSESYYDPPLAQLVVQHQFPTGGWLTTQTLEVVTLTTLMQWAVALPGRLGVLTAPGIHVDFLFVIPIGGP